MQEVLADLSKFALEHGLLQSHTALVLANFRVQDEFASRRNETKRSPLAGNSCESPLSPVRR